MCWLLLGEGGGVRGDPLEATLGRGYLQGKSRRWVQTKDSRWRNRIYFVLGRQEMHSLVPRCFRLREGKKSIVNDDVTEEH